MEPVKGAATVNIHRLVRGLRIAGAGSRPDLVKKICFLGAHEFGDPEADCIVCLTEVERSQQIDKGPIEVW